MGGFFGASWLLLAAPVLTYGLGYAYFVAYFGFFGLDVKAMAIPIEHYFAQGVLSFLLALLPPEDADFVGMFPLIGVVLLVVVVLAPLGRFAKFRSLAATLIAVPLFAVTTGNAFVQGRAGADEVLDGRASYLVLAQPAAAPDAALVADCPGPNRAADEAPPQDRSAWPAFFARANHCGLLHRVWQDSETTVVAAHWCWRAGGGQNCSWEVLRLPTEQVAATVLEGDRRQGGQP